MTTFLKGDTTAEMAIALAAGFDYSGKTVHLEYQGVRRSFANAVAGGSLTFAFSAAETAPMSLGAYPLRVWIEDATGEKTTIHNSAVKLRVTDTPADVRGESAVYLDVRGGLYGLDGLPERYTDQDIKAKINEIIRRLGGTVAVFLLCVLPAFSASLTVETAPKGEIYNDEAVVKNVTLDVSDLAAQIETNAAAIAQNAADVATKADRSDATLAPACFSGWSYSGIPEGLAVGYAPQYQGSGVWFAALVTTSGLEGSAPYYGTGDANALCVSFTGFGNQFTATRSIISYTLGAQSDKPLAAQEFVANATNVMQSAVNSLESRKADKIIVAVRDEWVEDGTGIVLSQVGDSAVWWNETENISVSYTTAAVGNYWAISFPGMSEIGAYNKVLDATGDATSLVFSTSLDITENVRSFTRQFPVATNFVNYIRLEYDPTDGRPILFSLGGD